MSNCKQLEVARSAALDYAGKLHDKVHEASALVSMTGVEIGWAPEDSIPILADALLDFAGKVITGTLQLAPQTSAAPDNDLLEVNEVVGIIAGLEDVKAGRYRPLNQIDAELDTSLQAAPTDEREQSQQGDELEQDCPCGVVGCGGCSDGIAILRAELAAERQRCINAICPWCREGGEPQLIEGAWAHHNGEYWQVCAAAPIRKEGNNV